MNTNEISSSQLGQDLWVIDTMKYKKNGYFVDLGALDGLTHSNTLMLENKYSWSGICVEANPYVFPKLSSNRNCMCVNSLLDSTDNNYKEFHCADELSFVENPNRAIQLEQLKMLLKQRNMEYHTEISTTRTLCPPQFGMPVAPLLKGETMPDRGIPEILISNVNYIRYV